MSARAVANISRLSSDIADTRGWRVVAALGCALILAWGLYRKIRLQPGEMANSDFYTYYQAALVVRHGGNPFAPVAAWISGYHPGSDLIASYYVYAPLFALLIVPFTLLPFQMAFTLWGLCNLVFLLGAVYALLRVAGIQPSLTSVLLLTTAASLLTTVRIEYYWGQADILLLFLVCAGMWARVARRSAVAGIVLGLACVIKPPLLVLVPFLLWKRELRLAAVTTGAFLAMLLAPFIWLGGVAWRDQLAIWRFWSNEYIPFIDNQSPKGVLARLFTYNAYVRPLVDAPVLVTLLWLVVVGLVVVVTAAVTAPRPLQRDGRSLLEVGVVISAMLLISPLTEYIYLTLLVFPLLALYVLLRQSDWRAPGWRALATWLVLSWALLCLPLQQVEYFFWPRMSASRPPVADLYTLLAPAFLYTLIAFMALQLYALRLVTGRTTRSAVHALFTDRLALAHVGQTSGGVVAATSAGTDGRPIVPRMRVLLFTNSVAVGGMEKHVELIARDLDRHWTAVHVICPRWEAIDPWAATLAQAAEYSARITPDRRYGMLALLRETARLWRQLRRWRIQVMHMHLTTHAGGFWALLAARLAGVRVIVLTEHLAPERPVPRLRRLWRNVMTRNYNHIVCVSPKNRDARTEHLYTPLARTSVVTNGVDVAPFDPTPPAEVAALRERLALPTGSPIVGTVVRFVAEKGLSYLLEAMPQVLTAAPETYLLMVGDGELRPILERQASDLGIRERVVFAGFQSDPRPYLSLMNAFVLPVPVGSASIGLLEAMAMRRAAIITFGGEGEAVVDGESGLCPPPREPRALADAILRIIRDPEFERRLGNNARRRIEESFSSRHVASQLLAIYERELRSIDSTTTSLLGSQTSLLRNG
jgi:glycosyltransferase involved in cell wall biosynthesis